MTSQTITVLVNGDRLIESDAYYNSETFLVLLSNAANASLQRWSGVGTIVDDEPTVSIDEYVLEEEGDSGTTAFTFNVYLSTAYDVPFSVDYITTELGDYSGGISATPGIDYTATSGTLTFPTGQTSETITVLVNGDRLSESDESFLVNLTGENGASSPSPLGTSWTMTRSSPSPSAAGPSWREIRARRT